MAHFVWPSEKESGSLSEYPIVHDYLLDSGGRLSASDVTSGRRRRVATQTKSAAGIPMSRPSPPPSSAAAETSPTSLFVSSPAIPAAIKVEIATTMTSIAIGPVAGLGSLCFAAEEPWLPGASVVLAAGDRDSAPDNAARIRGSARYATAATTAPTKNGLRNVNFGYGRGFVELAVPRTTTPRASRQVVIPASAATSANRIGVAHARTDERDSAKSFTSDPNCCKGHLRVLVKRAQFNAHRSSLSSRRRPSSRHSRVRPEPQADWTR